MVGNDVWLGYSALVMPGVNIGHGAVVAAGSLVASDVPPYAIVAGNPARVVRRRYEDEDVERLLRAAWWDWPVELVTEHARTIMSGTPADLERIAAWRTAARTVTRLRRPGRGPARHAAIGSSRTGARDARCLPAPSSRRSWPRS